MKRHWYLKFKKEIFEFVRYDYEYMWCGLNLKEFKLKIMECRNIKTGRIFAFPIALKDTYRRYCSNEIEKAKELYK